MTNAMIAPGATIGIIGGGQLGRMSALAAAHMGYRVHIFAPEADATAKRVTAFHTTAPYEDLSAVRAFAKAVDVVTFEFENIPFETAKALAELVPVRPGFDVLRTSQHRVLEKDFIQGLGIGTAPFQAVACAATLEAAVAALGVPSVLKTCELGYDGKGQAKIAVGDDLAAVWAGLNTTDAILEGFINFERELSIIVARSPRGEVRCFPLVENRHANHILDVTIAPAEVAPAVATEAERIARAIAEALNLEGLLAIELFLTREGNLLVNEMAPRPHNSGHWSMDACVTSQFEQHIRAVCNLPLGDTTSLYKAEMKNLIGADVNAWAEHLQDPRTKLHLYDKGDARPGRKMGHVTRLL